MTGYPRVSQRCGREALMTVENPLETARVDLSTGQVIQVIPNLASNRRAARAPGLSD